MATVTRSFLGSSTYTIGEASSRQYVGVDNFNSLGAGFSTTFTDNFNRSDANLESTPTSSGGGVWFWDGLIAGGISISSNGLACNTSNSTGTAYTALDVATLDQYVQFKVLTITAATGPFATVRMENVNNFVGIRCGNNGSNGQVQVFRRVGGTLTSLYQSGASAVAVNDIVKLMVIGGNFTVFVNGTILTGPTSIGATFNSTKAGIVGRAVVTASWIDDYEAAPVPMALAGTTTLTFTQTGNAGSGDIIGTTALAFTQTGDLKGAAPAGGTTTLTFTQSGSNTLATTATSTLTFTQTATGGMGSFIVGTSALTFTDTSNLIGFAPIDGPSTITFTGSGTFFIGGGGPIVGSTSLQFVTDNFSFLQGKAPISGSVPDFAFGFDIADLHGDKPIVGSSTLTFTQTLTGKAIRFGVGTTTLTFTHSLPLLTSPVQGSATATLSFAPANATINGLAQITGVPATLSFVTSSALRTALFPETQGQGTSLFDDTTGTFGGLFIETTAPLVTPPYLETV